MKRIVKTNSKRGFTLVEVMLAVAILSIASVMIMEGFLATMSYATNNTVYTRAGASNYAQTVKLVAEASSAKVWNRYCDPYGLNPSTIDIEHRNRLSGEPYFNRRYSALHFEGSSVGDIQVIVWEADNDGDLETDYPAYNVGSRYGYGDDTTDESGNAVEPVNHHRQSFYYLPAEVQRGDAYVNYYKCTACGHYGYIAPFTHDGASKWYCVYPYSPTQQVRPDPDNADFCGAEVANFG